jgi:ABC-type glycerol-3-phosphate transport system permease component
VKAGRRAGFVERAAAYAVLVTLALVVLFPFYWMTITSFKSEEQMRSVVSMFWPRPLVTENYRQLLSPRPTSRRGTATACSWR